jgi:signal transduction histidine kinase
MNSIQRQLSVGLITIVVVVILLLLQTSLWLFESGLRHYLQNDLRQEAEVLLGAVARDAHSVVLDPTRIPSNYQKPFAGHYYRIEISTDVWRSRSLWDYQLPLPLVNGLQQQLVDGPQAQQLLIYRADYQRFGQPISIVVARDYTPIVQSLRRVKLIGLGVGITALIFILLLQRFIVARALRPLENARRQIAQLQQGERGSLDIDVPDELQSLVQQINTLLLHTEETLKRSRNALGNLGHALKTPLAVLVSLSERRELDEHPELRQSLRAQLDFIQLRLGRELGRARLSGEALPGAQFNCAEELPALFATLELIHPRSLNLHWQTTQQLRLPWDREDVLELLGNLLDNACKWAKSQVRLDISAVDGFKISVNDDGPGISQQQREEVLSRGTRLDEQIAGHGLGLGIVRDIVTHLNGELRLGDSQLGGLSVDILLPHPDKKQADSTAKCITG